MRGYFFLIPILFAIILVSVEPAYATLPVRHFDYNQTDFVNQTHVFLGGLPPRLADGAGHFQKDYYFYNNTSTYTIATGFGTYVYVVPSCHIKFYEPTQSTVGMNATINSMTIALANSIHPFNFLTLNSSGTCKTSVIDTGKHLQINGTKSSSQASLTVSYTVDAGQPMETSYILKPNATGYYWQLTESQSNIPSVLILGNGTTINVNPTTFPNNVTRVILPASLHRGSENSVISYVDNFGKTFIYDYKTSSAFLSATGIALNPNTNQIVLLNKFITPTPLSANQTFIVDPTFGYTTGTVYGEVSNQIVSTNCPTTSASHSSTDAIDVEVSASVRYCQTSTLRWDISSIPTSALISSATFKTTNTISSNARTCDYVEVAHDPATATNLQIYLDAFSRAKIFSARDTSCTTSGANQVINLGANGTSSIQSHLGLGWFAIGKTFDNMQRDSLAHVIFQGSGQLQIVYLTPQAIGVRALYHDGTTPLFPALVTGTNFTKSGSLNTNSTGYTATSIVGSGFLQNYTIKDTTSNFIVNKTNNYNPVANTTFTSNTNIYQISCPSNGAGNDLFLETNDTDGHRINSFSTPSCASDNTITWVVHYLANGQKSNTFTASIYGKILNTTAFGRNPLFVSVNGTQYATQYNDVTHIITSNPFTIGTGFQSRTYSFSMILLNSLTATAPRSLTATASGDHSITLNWLKPLSNGSAALEGYKILRNSTILVNDTHTPNLLTYTDSSITAFHLQTYQLCGWNVAGCGASSNQASATPFVSTLGSAYLNYTIVGDVVGLTPSIIITQSNPSTMVYTVTLFNNTIPVETKNVNTVIPLGSLTYFPTFYTQMLHNQNYLFKSLVQNTTGGNITMTSNSTGSIIPAYTPSPSTLSWTINRPTPFDNLKLTVNREPITFKIECNYKTGLFDKGFWHNFSGVGYYSQTDIVPSSDTIYVSCYNDQLLFSLVSYGNLNGSGLLHNFTNSFGLLFGVPVVVLFLIFLAAIATGRSASTIFIMWTIALAVMNYLNFFPAPLAPWVWGVVVFLCILGILSGKKIL